MPNPAFNQLYLLLETLFGGGLRSGGGSVLRGVRDRDLEIFSDSSDLGNIRVNMN